MELTNHTFRKENHLPNLHDYVPAVNLQGLYDKHQTCEFQEAAIYFGSVDHEKTSIFRASMSGYG